MITIPNPEKAINGIMGGENNCFDLQFETSMIMPNGDTHIGFSMQQAPREIGELISMEEDYDVDEINLTSIDSDDSSMAVFRFIIPALGEETLEAMGITATEPVSAVIFGNQSAGEYSDDESDAYISGTLIIGTAASSDTGIEDSRQHIIDSINNNVSLLINSATNELKLLAKFDGKASQNLRNNIIHLNRGAVR